MKKNSSLFIAILVIAGIISCKNKGTSTGNPLVSLNMTGSAQTATASYKHKKNHFWSWLVGTAYAFAPPPTILDSTNLTVNLSDFWINISEIELKYDETAQAGEVNGDSIGFIGPYTINLFSNSPIPAASANLPLSALRRIKYKTTNISDLSSGAPAGMLNSNLYLTGTINGNNFIFQSSEQLIIETAGPNLVILNDGDSLLLQIQTADLIRKIDLSAVTNNTNINESNRLSFTNPCPLIDASASDVYTCFIKGLAAQTKVGKDDGDNVFGIGDDTVN